MKLGWSFAPLLLALPALAFVACGGDDAPAATSTTAAATQTRAPEVTATPTSGSTATPATATRPAGSPTAPRPDGTIDPLGGGDTQMKTVKAMPENAMATPLLNDVRMGVHPELGGWERIVFEFAGTTRPAAKIEYVDGVSQCGSGAPVALKGSAVLSVTFENAAAHNDAGQVTFAPRELTGPGTTILEAKSFCDFEAQLGWAVGLKGKQNFKISTFESPTRLVIDIKQ